MHWTQDDAERDPSTSPTVADELRTPLADWTDPAAPDGPEWTRESNIVRSID